MALALHALPIPTGELALAASLAGYAATGAVAYGLLERALRRVAPGDAPHAVAAAE